MLALAFPGTDAAFNLALEEALFESLSPETPGYFLVWRNAPSVIVGRHQNAAEEVDAAYCRENGIQIVRRSTGGGAVYHDLGNVNFSFLLWVDKNRLAGFEEFMEPMVKGLRDLGIDAESSSRNDIAVAGRKVAGTAQRRDGQRMLHHGCLLVDADASMLTRALAADPEKFRSKGVASHRARVANLREFLPEGLGREECVARIVEAMKKRCANGDGAVPEAVFARAEELAQKKYRSWEWTWGSSPRFSERRRRRFPWGRLECLLDVKDGRILSCRIFGDFFALRDVKELESMLAGQRADAQSLREALADVPLESWFAGAERGSLLALLCGEDGRPDAALP